jgi:ankyrin repeat protein
VAAAELLLKHNTPLEGNELVLGLSSKSPIGSIPSSVIRALISGGVDLDRCNKDSLKALYIATRTQQFDTARILCQMDYMVDTKGIDFVNNLGVPNAIISISKNQQLADTEGE